MANESPEADDTTNPPLAQWCSICGDGYHPNLEIEIADGTREDPDGEVYGWAHRQCIDDHDAVFLEAFGESEGEDHA